MKLEETRQCCLNANETKLLLKIKKLKSAVQTYLELSKHCLSRKGPTAVMNQGSFCKRHMKTVDNERGKDLFELLVVKACPKVSIASYTSQLQHTSTSFFTRVSHSLLALPAPITPKSATRELETAPTPQSPKVIQSSQS